MKDSELTFRPLGTVKHGMIDGYVAQTGVVVLRVGKWKVRVVQVVDDAEFEKSGLSAPGWDEFVRRRDGVEEALDIVAGKQGKERHGKEKKRESKAGDVDNTTVRKIRTKGNKAEPFKDLKRIRVDEAENVKEKVEAEDEKSTENSNVRDLTEDASNADEKKWRGTEDMFRKINKP